MATAIRFSELKALGKSDREKALNGLISEAKAPVNGQAFVVKGKIQAYETRYELNSADLPAAIRDNKLRETAEVADWLFWIRVRELCGIG